MIRISKLRPLLSAATKTLNPTLIAPRRTLIALALFRPPPPIHSPPHQLHQRLSVSGTPKGKARLKTIASLKKKSFVQNKKGKGGGAVEYRGRGPPVTKTRPIILRLNAKLRQREAEREKLGLVSKLRKRDVEVEKARREASKMSPKEGDSTLMGLSGMSFVELGFVGGYGFPKYNLTVEDGRRLAKEYSRLLMVWDRERQMAERGLLELRKAAIEALPENLRKAALMPIPKKKKEGKEEGADKKKLVGKGKQKPVGRKRPGFAKKGAGKGAKNGVALYGGPKASTELDIPAARSFHHEYNSMACTIEIVDDLRGAIEHIHSYGSAHTDCIVAEDQEVEETFIPNVDSAAVFHNASTRFCDGARFGLGAEANFEEENEEPNWAPLQDSYMLTNPKLKDWDKMP